MLPFFFRTIKLTTIDDDSFLASSAGRDLYQRHISSFMSSADAGDCDQVRMGSSDLVNECRDLLQKSYKCFLLVQCIITDSLFIVVYVLR